jgi:inositol transport system substrate-binding protein
MLTSQGGKQVLSVNGKGFKDINLAVIQQVATAPASIMLYDALQAYAKQYYPEVKYTMVDPNNDASKQSELMQQFIAQKVDCITLNAADADVLVSSVQDAIKAGIPVVNVGAALSKEVGQHNVISENFQAGEFQMNYICEKLLKGKGNVAIIRGQDGHQATTDRSKGYTDVLKKYPEIKVVFEDTASWNRDTAMSLVENWLQSGKQFDAILCQNDSMACGAADAVVAAGKQNEIKVAGCDFSEDGAKYMVEGKLAVNILQNCPAQGTNTFQMAVELALGNDPKQVVIPFELITPDNLKEYVAKYWPNLSK